jgi:hypothetical protein
MPFPIRKIQVDNGTEFSLGFALTCQELGVRVRYIKPRRWPANSQPSRSRDRLSLRRPLVYTALDDA